MKFEIKELERMTKAQLIMLISKMYEEPVVNKIHKSTAGIYVNGASDLVRKYHAHETKMIKENKGGDR